jgi:DNA topoisomerase VI subunit A
MEPHTGREVPVGTLEVDEYEFPEHVFDKLLPIEKRGLRPVWKSVRLGERYDMGIINGGGQPTEAMRKLFQRAQY